MPDVLVVIGVGGMGEAIARRLGSGKTVLLADSNEQLLTRVADSLIDDGMRVETATVDVSSRNSVAALAATAASLGNVMQFAHTAGLSPVQAPTQAILNVDLLGVAYSVEEFSSVVAPGAAGVVIASTAGSSTGDALPAEMKNALAATPSDELLSLPFLAVDAIPNPGVAYGYAKLANQLRVHAASVAWGQRNARINTVSPGVISTPMGRQELSGEHGDFMRQAIAASGTHRIGTSSDIAAAVAFLLGPDATFITGTDLLVDGGMTAASRARTLTSSH